MYGRFFHACLHTPHSNVASAVLSRTKPDAHRGHASMAVGVGWSVRSWHAVKYKLPPKQKLATPPSRTPANHKLAAPLKRKSMDDARRYPSLPLGRDAEFALIAETKQRVLALRVYLRYASPPSVDEARIPLSDAESWRKAEIELGRVVVDCTSNNSADGSTITVRAPMVVELVFAYAVAPERQPSAVRCRVERDALIVTLAYPDATAPTVVVIDTSREALRSDHVDITDIRLRFPICLHLYPCISAHQALRAAASGL
jgi:hypothetical protein